MWVRLEVMGHIRILARPCTAVRALEAPLWLLNPISTNESLHVRKTYFFFLNDFLDYFAVNQIVKFECPSSVVRSCVAWTYWGPHSHFSHPCKYQHKPNIEMWSRML